jgi:hypothetical protein
MAGHVETATIRYEMLHAEVMTVIENDRNADVPMMAAGQI